MKRKNLIVNTAMAGLFCALICAGAFIRIPFPGMPITLQVFFVLLAGLILPWKTSFAACLTYMLLGLIGLPIFSGGGGIGYVLLPNFGFIIGFLIASTVMSLVLGKKKAPLYMLILTALLGEIIIYTVGTVYFALIINFYLHGDKSFIYILQIAFVPYIPKELVSIIVVALASYKIRPMIAKIK